MQYTMTKEQGLYSTLKYYACPGCSYVIYLGQTECFECKAKFIWKEVKEDDKK